MKHLDSSFKLPNGTILQNRIAKSAMSENMGTLQNAPTKNLIKAYNVWSKGGSGLLITGNVMIDSRALGEPRNVVVEDRSNFKLLQDWAKSCEGTGTHIWPQLNHPGRQAFAPINKEVAAPSAVSLKMGAASRMFKKPTPLSEDAIWEIIKRFGNTAKIMQDAGFTGCQIHGAHGYLVSQFLSPLSNTRKDKWGGILENRMRFVIEIYREIRTQVGKEYPIGIKINSADFQRGGFSEEESLEVIRILSKEGIDMLEISGGTYEKPVMVGHKQKKSTQEREAYFLEYIQKARKITTKPLMLTGGFRTVSIMEQALIDGNLDIVGLARPFCLYPELAQDIFCRKIEGFVTPLPSSGIKMIDKMGGIELPWYELQIHRLGKGKRPKKRMSGLLAFWFNLKSMIVKSLIKNN